MSWESSLTEKCNGSDRHASNGRMRVDHVVARISPVASGPSYSVPGLCRALAGEGTDVHLHVLDPLPVRKHRGVEVSSYRAGPRPMALGLSAHMRRGLHRAARGVDLFHNHGLWMMPNVYVVRAALRRGLPLVTSPRGTLSPRALSISPIRKRIIWQFGQKGAVHSASCLHATAESELADIRRMVPDIPVAVIPNGIDLPRLRPAAKRGGRRVLLYLGRIHAIKGLETLIRAWRAVQDRARDWECHIVGPAVGGHDRELRALARELGARRLRLRGEVSGVSKRAVLEGADLFALPSESENFAISVAEALAHGIPVLVSKGAPWSAVEREACGWWVAPGVEHWVEHMRHAFELDELALHEMGRRGRAWMEREFAWETIGARMRRTYDWLVNGGSAPAWVDTPGSGRACATGGILHVS